MPRYVRALVSIIVNGNSEHQTLTVATKDIGYNFDAADIDFTTTCTFLLRSIAVTKAIKELSQSRDKMMSGITQHLRTPVHSIMAATTQLKHRYTVGSCSRTEHSIVPMLSQLDVIERASQQLMQFVDAIVKQSDWLAAPSASQSISILGLDDLEAQTIEAIVKVIKWSYVERTCVYFERHLCDDIALVTEDKSLIMDCLQPILLNALQYTVHGSVVVRYSTDSMFSSLIFDIKDTGAGVSTTNREQIFKANGNSSSSSTPTTTATTTSDGGLASAMKIVQGMNGSLELVTSSERSGSLFRVTLRDLTFACPWSRAQDNHLDTYFAALPQRYCLLRRPDGNSSGVRAFVRLLEARGIKQTSLLTGDVLAVVPYTHMQEEYEGRLAKAAEAVVCVSLVPNQADVSRAQAKFPTVLFFKCPFTTSRMKEILLAINERCKASLR